MNKFILGYIFLTVNFYLSQCQLLGLPENAPCGNAGGVCKRLGQCPIVGNPRVTRPLLCTFIDREPVVCCPPSRAQEMCLRYDAMACNAVESNRRRRNIKEIAEPVDTSRLPVEFLEGLLETEKNEDENTFVTTERHPTSTTKRISTTTKTKVTRTTKRTQPTLTTTVRTTRRTTPTSTERGTDITIPTTTVTPDHLLNYTGEFGAATRMLSGSLVNIDNDLADTKIVGGIMAMPRELPYMALLGYGNDNNREWACGASIISENFVLSAAHCAQDSRLGPARWARVAELDLSQENSPHQDIPIRNTYIHPDYRAPAVYNDIALFRLERNVQFSSWIQPICLQVSNDVLTSRGIAAGWGRTDFVGETSSRLLKVDLSLVDTNQCRNQLGRAGRFLPQGVNLNTMICAGENEGGKDTCTGDSGGPLVVQGIGRCIRTQIGVVSFGRQCAMPNTPGIYTRVSSFITWIENIVWPR